MSANRYRIALQYGLLVGVAATTARAGAEEPAKPVASQGAPAETVQLEKVPFLGGFLRETRIVYPLRVDDWQAANEHRYDDPAYGVSVRYVHGADEDRWIDVYFYPAGVLDAAELDQAADAERRSILALAGRPGAYDALDVGALRRFEAIAASDQVAANRGYAMDMWYEREGKAYSSAMTFLLEQLYFVKARMSADVARLDRDAVRTTLQGFTARLAPKLVFSSSGQCWMPLPIEPLSADAPAPPGASVSIGLDAAEPDAFLVRDRVLARNPSDHIARAVMLIGMSRLGRRFPGCESAEPTNPVVPDGMREIRMEYAVPQDNGSGSPRPLRRTRTGIG